ncbi:hypothetical protein KCP74_22525 [Salmonella enterica subsp. enterica]|nr:hypothetical protein KCP74_22525 [Salmonella enterica subsp. enterica]
MEALTTRWFYCRKRQVFGHCWVLFEAQQIHRQHSIRQVQVGTLLSSNRRRCKRRLAL